MYRPVLALLPALSIALLASPDSYAADIAVPPPVKAPAPVYAPPVFTWTGFYAGANIGWGWSDGDGTMFVTGLAPIPFSGDGDGFLGGVQAGYNWQTGAFVFGLETDFQGSSGRGDISGGGLGTIGTLKSPWFGTIRGRVGYAMDRWMLYVTGGGAYAHLDFDGTLPTGAFSSSTTAWSWTIGGGVEAMLWDRWSGKLEYLYIDTPSDFPAPTGTVAVDGTMNNHILRAGLNYHF